MDPTPNPEHASSAGPTPIEEAASAEGPTHAPESRLEKVRKIYVRDLQEKDHLHTVFLVTRKSRSVGRAGKPYLTLILSDKTGDVDGRIFDAAEQLEPMFAAGDYVLVRGEVITFHGKLQIVVQALERLDPEPIDNREFVSSAPAHEGSRAVAQIREIVERVHDSHVKSLLLAFLDDPAVVEGLPRAPAGKGIHHAYRGGLADHILSVMKLAHRLADHYPMADRDLLIAGALLHDIGKVSELSYDRSVDYTDEGRLVGHLVMTAQKIREKSSQIPRFPAALEHHITHLVLAHHGQLAHGSPKIPLTLEAMLVHSIDLIDSQVSSWLELMAKDSNEKWTDFSRVHDRQLWKGPVPTSRNKSAVEGRGRRRDAADRRRQSASVSGGAERPPRHAPEGEPKDPSLPKDLTFKPLSAIAGQPPAPEETKDPSAST